MLDNPLSRIERTKDAYMGRPQELQKRANMTKELVDLLAMQQLKKDLDAVKRNQAMQAQGNPSTIKDQMQQGLMGEYRQQAAKEMGVGPSEMDTVNRAQQGISQGGPRMPQGAPQQMPQQAQGVMSQARPVQLAGGGIVAFSKAGSVQVPEGLGSDELADFLRSTLRKQGGSANYQALEFKRLMGEGGFDPLGRPLEEEKTDPQGSSGTRRRRARAGLPQLTAGNATTPKSPNTLGLNAQIDAEYEKQGIARPRYAPAPNVAQRQEEFETRRSEAQQRAEQREKEKYEASMQGQLDAVRTSGIAAGISPYQLDETQRTQAESELELDADKRGLAAVERIRGLSKMGENEKLLENMQKRVQATYDETAPSRRDNLIDLLTAGGRGGITGVGVRDRQLRDAATERRRQLDQDVMGIQATTIELNRNFGADAAKAYADAEANVIAQKQNARNFLQNAEQAEVASLMDKARLTMDEQQNVRQLFSDQERNRLLAEQITGDNMRALAKDVSTAKARVLEARSKIFESVRLQSRYNDLDTLDPSDSDDARKKKLLEDELAAEVAARAADLDKLGDELTVRQLKLDQARQAQQERLTPREEITLSPEAQKAMASAGG